jgi:citronellyl-CoA dehydrogenase
MQHTLYTRAHALQRPLKKLHAKPRSTRSSTNGRAEIFPAHEVFKMGKLGFLGVNKPVEYGGRGLDYSYAAAFAEALSAHPLRRHADGHRRADRHGHAGAGALRLRRAAPRVPRAGDQRRLRRLPGRVGVGAGSDVASIKTHARKDGDDYVINGGKMWTPTARRPTGCCLLANTSEGAATRTRR